MSPLIAFLNRQLAVPFVWGGFDGGTDCCLMLGDWWQCLHGVDPVAHLRMTYDSRASCHRQTGWLRDPISVVASVAEDRCGLLPTGAPVRGDIGLVRMDAHTCVGAICIGGAWAMKPEGTGLITPRGLEIIAAWGVGYVDP